MKKIRVIALFAAMVLVCAGVSSAVQAWQGPDGADQAVSSLSAKLKSCDGTMSSDDASATKSDPVTSAAAVPMVPEPITMAVLAIGGVLPLMRRRS